MDIENGGSPNPKIKVWHVKKAHVSRGISRLVAEHIYELLDFPPEIVRITDDFLDVMKEVGRFRLFFDNKRVSFCRTTCLECFEEIGQRCGERDLCFVPLAGKSGRSLGASNDYLLKSEALYFFSKLWAILEGDFPSTGCDVNQQISNAVDFSCDRERLKLLKQRKTELIAPHLIKITRQVDPDLPDAGYLEKPREIVPDVPLEPEGTQAGQFVEVDYLFKIVLFFDESKEVERFAALHFNELLDDRVEKVIGVNFFTEKVKLGNHRAAKILIWAMPSSPKFEFLQRIYYKGTSAVVVVTSPESPGHCEEMERIGEKMEYFRESHPEIPVYAVVVGGVATLGDSIDVKTERVFSFSGDEIDAELKEKLLANIADDVLASKLPEVRKRNERDLEKWKKGKQ
ncbi:MAG: hypothetical protein ACTSU5_16885 [Promethearchaeota archaeon]